MSAEKLPEYVENSLEDFSIASFKYGMAEQRDPKTSEASNDDAQRDALEDAILRYANERVAEALEKAAKVAEACAMERMLTRTDAAAAGGDVVAVDAKTSEAFRIRDAIRSLIPSEARKA